MAEKIYNAGIRITRKCNLRCAYCNIPNSNSKELFIEEWKRAIDILEGIGVTDISILGGEPTEYNELAELIKYISKKDIKTSLVTNAVNNFEIINRLIDNGLTSLGISIDTLNYKNSISPYKCLCGKELLEKILNTDPKCKIIDYAVLNKKNIKDICKLIEYMSSKNIYIYFLPFHYGGKDNFEHRKNIDSFAFTTEDDIELYGKYIDKIITMKKNGFLIDNSIDFLEMTKKHIKKLDWKCNGLSEIRIDSDGKMVCCCDKKGNVNKKYSIFDMKDNNALENFVHDRNIDSSTCKGCLWPSSFEAEIRKIIRGDRL